MTRALSSVNQSARSWAWRMRIVLEAQAQEQRLQATNASQKAGCSQPAEPGVNYWEPP